MERNCPRRSGCPRGRRDAGRPSTRDESVIQAVSLSVPQALQMLPEIENVVSVTRNASASMTTIGRYGAPQFIGDPLKTEAGRTCLRIDPSSLHTALAAERVPACRKPMSLHILDHDGTAVHESYLTSMDHDTQFDVMADGSEPRRDPEIHMAFESLSKRGGWSWKPRAIRPSGGRHLDAGFHIDSILGDNGIARRASLPQWGDTSAWQIDPVELPRLFTLLGEAWMPLGIALGNVGVVQYHQGEVEKVRATGHAMQITSKTTNVTIALDDIQEAWISCVDSGIRYEHILELYDWRYHCVVQFKETNEPDANLSTFWQQILCTLPRISRCSRSRG